MIYSGMQTVMGKSNAGASGVTAYATWLNIHDKQFNFEIIRWCSEEIVRRPRMVRLSNSTRPVGL
jgi:hypothetical protein